MYVQCFRQIVDKNPTPSNYVLLGDAFMAIEEPDKALEIYEQAWITLNMGKVEIRIELLVHRR